MCSGRALRESDVQRFTVTSSPGSTPGDDVRTHCAMWVDDTLHLVRVPGPRWIDGRPAEGTAAQARGARSGTRRAC